MTISLRSTLILEAEAQQEIAFAESAKAPEASLSDCSSNRDFSQKGAQPTSQRLMLFPQLNHFLLKP
jgi:hypothetical protein